MRCGSFRCGLRRARVVVRTTTVPLFLVLLSLVFPSDCKPVELFHVLAPLYAAADDRYLYASAADGILWRITRATDVTIPLAFSPIPIDGIMSDGNTVWYVTNNEIHAVPVEGGESRFVAAGSAPVSDGQYLYWFTDTAIRRMRVDGSSGIEDVAPGSWPTFHVASDALYLLRDGQLFRVPKTGGEILPVFANPDVRSFASSADGGVRFLGLRQELTSTFVDLYQFDPVRFTTVRVATRSVPWGLRGSVASAIVTADRRLYVVVAGVGGSIAVSYGQLVGDYPDGSQWRSQEGPRLLLAAGDDGIYVLSRKNEMVIERLCSPSARGYRFGPK